MDNTLKWLHISDIHFCSKTEWRDSTARDSLIEYLKSIFKKDSSLRPDLIFCTGDIAFGENGLLLLSDQYKQAKLFFDNLLDVCGQEESTPLPKERLFVIPGNHDINRNNVNKDAQETLTRWADTSANYVNHINDRFADRTPEFTDAIKRLDEYAQFVQSYLPHQHDKDGRHCFTNIININGINIGIGGFNTAWSCAGPEDDRTVWLAAEWQFNAACRDLKNANFRIGLIHHPVDWLNQTERDLVTSRISTDFHFWLHGHSHKAWVVPTQSNVVIAAGAVGAQNSEEFGINLVKIDLSEFNGKVYLHQRKAGGASWTIAPVEVHAPDGQWPLENLPSTLKSLSVASVLNQEADRIKILKEDSQSNSNNEFIDRILSSRLDEALESFSSQPKVWVSPIIAQGPEVSKDTDSVVKIELPELLSTQKSLVITSPPQFGLTCLALFLVREAWRSNNPSLWLYLDSKYLSPKKSTIEKAVKVELKLFGCEIKDIKCVVLDSWASHDKDALTVLQEVCKYFKDIRVIVMQTVDNNPFMDKSGEVTLDRVFEQLYLWALPRNQVRKVVAGYINAKYIGDEDTVTAKVIKDLSVLNLHRTPYNCLTLLKVSEIDFDESPVNRCEMIKQVLFLLFNIDEIPTYKIRPDLKDSEYVLGYFCEKMIRESKYYFTRDCFLSELEACCAERIFDLEVQVVFDVLSINHIIIKRGDLFCFRFTYWIYYFAAQRMHHNPDFAEYILQDQRYANYPEIIEFYTGIDRRREDALRVMIRDLRVSSDKVQEKCGLPDNLNPYKFARWRPTAAALEHMKNEMADGVKSSNLPASIKDDYADRLYDRAKPYDQDIRNILAEHSLVYMVQTMMAGARALRNSDYVNPDIKRELLHEIMRCWGQVSKVLITLLPLLIKHGSAAFGGYGFYLAGNFGQSPEERLHNILRAVPRNIVNWYEEDLFSQKMGLLLYDRLKNETNDLTKHEIILMLINQRPREWKSKVYQYITSIKKDSFYLLDVYDNLRNQYRFSFATPQNQTDLKYLIKMAIAKHETGSPMPNISVISNKKYDVCVPTRVVDQDN